MQRLVLIINETKSIKNFQSRKKLEDYVNKKCQEFNVDIYDWKYDWKIEQVIEKNNASKISKIVDIHTVILK